ncbi:hypothetical protein [Pseudooceanicola nitratireducens]|uniref:hypothetical protein n=1 Tax=Pseudooceanicola nitratireducens TaxID=517719 RepID=UPI003C7D0B71
MNRFFALAVASVVPPTQGALMIGAVLFGSSSFTLGQWLAGLIIPFGSWYMLLFG